MRCHVKSCRHKHTKDIVEQSSILVMRRKIACERKRSWQLLRMDEQVAHGGLECLLEFGLEPRKNSKPLDDEKQESYFVRFISLFLLSFQILPLNIQPPHCASARLWLVTVLSHTFLLCPYISTLNFFSAMVLKNKFMLRVANRF